MSAEPARPAVGRRAALEARIREVGPRDGFQNEPEVIPTETRCA